MQLDLQLISSVASMGRVFDLGQPLYVGMPRHPNHPPFSFSLTKEHGEIMYPDGISAAGEIFTTGGHVGTHIDGLGHVSKDGKLYQDLEVAALQSYSTGISDVGIDITPPIIRRGVLLDVPALSGREVLDASEPVTAEDLERAAENQNIEINEGDVVLIRTGWIRYFSDSKKYVAFDVGEPGPDDSAGWWLAEKKVSYAGADTLAFEQTPAPSLPVHVILLVENGIQIMEVLNLEELAEAQVYEFLFIALPLKIRNATGSPIRPIAIG